MCQREILESKEQRKLNLVLLIITIFFVVMVSFNVKEGRMTSRGPAVTIVNPQLETSLELIYLIISSGILYLKFKHPKDFKYEFIVDETHIKIISQKGIMEVEKNFRMHRNLVDDQLVLTSVNNTGKSIKITYSDQVVKFLKSVSFWEVPLTEIAEFD